MLSPVEFTYLAGVVDRAVVRGWYEAACREVATVVVVRQQWRRVGSKKSPSLVMPACLPRAVTPQARPRAHPAPALAGLQCLPINYLHQLNLRQSSKH